MARALTVFSVAVLFGACRLPEAPVGTCNVDSDCRKGLVCQSEGRCGACPSGGKLSCSAGAFAGERSCELDGGAGACAKVACAEQRGACRGSAQLSSEASGCGPASFAATPDAGWASTELCGDGIDNDCDGVADPSPGPCPMSAGVCNGAMRRCGQMGCIDADYGANYQPFESKCDGLDNDCDGLVDVSREKVLHEGAREVVMVAESLEPDAAYRSVVARGSELRSSTWSPSFGLMTDMQNKVGDLPDTTSRTMLTANQTATGTHVAWRVDGGIRVARIDPASMFSLPRTTIATDVILGPKIAADFRSEPALVWSDTNTMHLLAVRDSLGWAAPAAVNCAHADWYCSMFFFPVSYLESIRGNYSALVLDSLFPDTHYFVPLHVRPSGDDAGCMEPDGGTPTTFGTFCAPLIPLSGTFFMGATMGIRNAWISSADGPSKADLRLVLGNRSADPTHSFVGPEPYPRADFGDSRTDEGSLALSRARDGGPGRAWFVRRTDAGILAHPELANRPPPVTLSTTGRAAPAAVWNPLAPDNVAVAYVVDRPDGGTAVVGRLLCRPQ